MINSTFIGFVFLGLNLLLVGCKSEVAGPPKGGPVEGLPTINYVSNTTGSVGVALTISPTELTTHGVAILSCVASPTLPGWASLNSATCVITGTPTAPLAQTTFNVVATNAVGASIPASLTLKVHNIPVLSYTGNAVGTVGALLTITPDELAANESNILSCAASPTLPGWASLNSATCVITGTPTAPLAQTTFNVVATNAVGASIPASLTLKVHNIPVLSYTGNAVGTVGSLLTITPVELAANESNILSCAASPTLPGWASLNSATCVITGTPTAPLAQTTFNVVATNAVGASIPASLKLEAYNTWAGTKQLGASGMISRGNDVQRDSSNNLYIGGSTTGGIGGNALIGTQDLFVTKYDPSGQRLWLRELGASGAQSEIQGLSVSGNGAVVAVGSTTGGLNGNTNSGSRDIVVVKYNEAGVLQWLRQLGVVSKSSYAHSVAIDASGNIYLCGQTSGGLSGNTFAGGDTDYILAKYSEAGVLQWVRQNGPGEIGKGSSTVGLSIDNAGNVILSGATGGALNGNTQTGFTDYIVAKYNSSGTLQWLRQMGAPNSNASSFGESLAVDEDDNVFLVGSTNFGLSNQVQTGSRDMFLAKYSSAGVFQWLNQWGAVAAFTQANDITMDPDGKLTIVGYTSAGLNGNVQTGTYDLFAGKFLSDGSTEWITQTGASSAQTIGIGVMTDSHGNVFATGSTTKRLNGDAQTGWLDFFLTKFSSTGSIQ